MLNCKYCRYYQRGETRKNGERYCRPMRSVVSPDDKSCEEFDQAKRFYCTNASPFEWVVPLQCVNRRKKDYERYKKCKKCEEFTKKVIHLLPRRGDNGAVRLTRRRSNNTKLKRRRKKK